MSQERKGSWFADGEAYEHYVGRWSRPVGQMFLDWLSLAPDRQTGPAIFPHPAFSVPSCLRPREVTFVARQTYDSQRVVESIHS